MDSYKGLEMKLDNNQKKRLIFSELFILQNKMETNFDKLLGEITSKQFLVVVIVSAFPSPPSLTEVARHAGCSRQNIKKVAAVLEKNGFITFATEKESRALRILLTPKFHEFYGKFMKTSASGLEVLFAGMGEAQIDELFNSLHQIEENINRMPDSDIKN